MVRNTDSTHSNSPKQTSHDLGELLQTAGIIELSPPQKRLPRLLKKEQAKRKTHSTKIADLLKDTKPYTHRELMNAGKAKKAKRSPRKRP